MKRSSLLVVLLLFLQAISFSQTKQIAPVDSLMRIMFTSASDTTKVNMLIETGENFYDIAPDSSMRYWETAESFCNQSLSKTLNAKETYAFKSSLARTYNNMAYYYQRNSFRTSEAFVYYRKALNLEEKIGNVKEEGKTLNNLATLYSNMGDMDSCIHYHHRALKAREKSGYTRGIIISLNNLTAVYVQQGELAKAMEYSKKAEFMSRKNKLLEDLANIYYNRGSILIKQGDTSQAELYFIKSLQAAKSGSEYNRCEASIKMAEFFLAVNKPDSAIAILKRVLPIATRLKATYPIINIEKDLGMAYLKNRKTGEAKTHVITAFELAKKINKRPDIGNCAELLSTIYQSEGNTGKALEMYKLFIAIRDSSFNEATRKNTIREQLQYDYEKKAAADSLEMAAKKRITDAERKHERTQRYALYVGVVLLLAFGGFVYLRFRESQKQQRLIRQKNKVTEIQKKIIEEKQNEIVGSMNYAKRIQYSLLANEGMLREFFKDCFVLFKPKDIVSGDFYWAARQHDCFYLAVCDSTGHGVPGAFMSLLSIGFLSEAIKERSIIEPDKVFNYVRSRLEESVNADGNRDGFDGILMAINEKTKTITYAAANNSPVIVKNGELINLPCDKMPVGRHEHQKPFQLFSIDYKDASTIYFYTDGFADQFGGPKGKKFKYKKLEQILLGNSAKPMQEQLNALNAAFDDWRTPVKTDTHGITFEQTDDVCVVGLHLHN
ncbi:MAG TPA: tetratricopeptide repeat protein [Bacteroidia bacterium]